jgi:DNA gyrase inhibitor GyrI
MSEITVRIVQLEPLHVASVQGFVAGPENLAHEKLAAWAGPRGYLDDLAHHRVFGFNNPNPTPATRTMLRAVITVGAGGAPEEGVRILDFPGGLYAVAHMKASTTREEIPATWAELVKWVEDSPYRPARHQWLEEHLRIPGGPADDWALDLYMPISL